MNKDISDKLISESGMTLRDYFAAVALNGLITSGMNTFSAAKEAYKAADHMLHERNKKNDM